MSKIVKLIIALGLITLYIGIPVCIILLGFNDKEVSGRVTYLFIGFVLLSVAIFKVYTTMRNALKGDICGSTKTH